MPFDILARILHPLKQPALSSRYPKEPPLLAPGVRGLPVVDPARCDRRGACVLACPTAAIELSARTWAVDAGRCIFCARCADACPTGAITLSSRVELAARDPRALVIVTELRPASSALTDGEVRG
jgi:formate hydrogenlyase subunit 6/NADH:ubiquinone oxidoreductase subunit I